MREAPLQLPPKVIRDRKPVGHAANRDEGIKTLEGSTKLQLLEARAAAMADEAKAVEQALTDLNTAKPDLPDGKTSGEEFARRNEKYVKALERHSAVIRELKAIQSEMDALKKQQQEAIRQRHRRP